MIPTPVLRFWFWLRAASRRAWCRWFGCIPANANRLFEAGEDTKVRVAVTVHCHRCWRRYSRDEQTAAVALPGVRR